MSEFVWICYHLTEKGFSIEKVVNTEEKAVIWCETGEKRYYHVWRVE